MGIEVELKKAYEDVISVFYDIAQDLSSTFDRSEMIEIALNLMKKVIDYEAISFLEYYKSSEMFMVIKNINYTHPLKKALNKMLREGLIDWAARLGKPFINIEDIEDIKTTVIVPLLNKGELEGAIILHTKKNEEYFDQNRLRILQIISNQLTIGFENLSLYKNLEKRNHKLNALKNYMDNIIRSMTNGIIVLDNDGIIRVLNKKCEDMLKIDYKRVVGKSIGEIGFDSIMIREMAIHKNKLAKGVVVFDEEFEIKIGEVETLPIGMSSTMLTNEEQTLGVIYVLRDMRESREIKELKRIDKLKDEFLSMVSHELRTPLTSIKAYTETLIFMAEDNEDEATKEFLEIILEESERLTRLINDVLDLSKIEAGKMTFILKEEKIAEIVEKSVKNMMGFADSKNIKLEVTKEDVPLVLVDKDRTIQVLANLISNAVKFTPEDGKIIVSVANEDENFVRICVKDNGHGIIKEDYEKIFEKFKQSENIMTRQAGGTGLGLPICKNIIGHFGGKIWVESEIGVGSSFIFTIPVATKIEGGEVVEQENISG